MDIKTSAVQYVQPQVVQQLQEDMLSEHFGDINLEALLNATGRHRNNTPDDGYSNGGFNAVLEQVGDGSFSPEKVNLLKSSLPYDDEISFYMSSCRGIVNIFQRPVANIWHDDSEQVKVLSFYLPGVGRIPYFKKETSLAQKFVEWCLSSNWAQAEIDDLSQYLETVLSIDVSEATANDIVSGLLKYPETIALLTNPSGHISAAPHRDRPREDNVPELLREAAVRQKEANLHRAAFFQREAADLQKMADLQRAVADLQKVAVNLSGVADFQRGAVLQRAATLQRVVADLQRREEDPSGMADPHATAFLQKAANLQRAIDLRRAADLRGKAEVLQMATADPSGIVLHRAVGLLKPVVLQRATEDLQKAKNFQESAEFFQREAEALRKEEEDSSESAD
jgi:hypothetical protein